MGKMKALSSYGSCLMAEIEAYFTELRKHVKLKKPLSYIGPFPSSGAPLLVRCNDIVRKQCPQYMSLNTPGATRCSNKFEEVEEKFEDFIKHRMSNLDIARLKAFLEREACSRKARLGYQRCQDFMKQTCDNISVRTVKAIRLQLKTVMKYMEHNPDVKVIYFIRDPRGIIHSRIKIRYLAKLSANSPGFETRLLCKKMRNDLVNYEFIKQSMSDQILFMKYEDLAEDPFANLERIYSFLGFKVNKAVEDWLIDSTHAKKDDKTLLGTQRADSKSTASMWKHELTVNQTKYISSVCRDVLEKAGYPLHV